jgi:hypothetical protein
VVVILPLACRSHRYAVSAEHQWACVPCSVFQTGSPNEMRLRIVETGSTLPLKALAAAYLWVSHFVEQPALGYAASAG